MCLYSLLNWIIWLMPPEILQQVRTQRPSLLRPALGNDEQCVKELRTLATSCWAHEAADRPSFNDIDEVYKKIRRYVEWEESAMLIQVHRWYKLLL